MGYKIIDKILLNPIFLGIFSGIGLGAMGVGYGYNPLYDNPYLAYPYIGMCVFYIILARIRMRKL